MKKILVTGAAGFIGWQTCKKLLEQGAEVVGVDNMNDYYDLRLKEHRLSTLVTNENFKFYKLDIENLGALDILFKDNWFDAVINLAARAGVRYSMVNPHVYLSTNTQGTLNLLEAMRSYGVKKMVLASTSSLYAGHSLPFHEDMPIATPISPYAASKRGAELMAYSYHFLYGLDITVLRYFTVYGPAGRPDMSIFRFIRWIDDGVDIELFGDATQSRDFTYIEDIAEGTILATKPLGYEIINLGGGMEPKSLKHVIARLEDMLGKKATIRYEAWNKADIMETKADITKAQRLLGWQPKVGLEEGLQRSVDWYKAQHSWVKDVVL